MATALQLAANRRNAKKSTGPRTAEGKKRASLNHVRHGMTAKTVILPHESAVDYEEIRAALIEDYAPATSQELMLVDQIAAGYWRTIRARRYETAIFDNRLRTRKHELGMDTKPNPAKDDEGYAVMLQVVDSDDLKNYFRYDATISRDYYRAIATLEKMQAARRREEDRQERNAHRTATVKERTNPPVAPEPAGFREAPANKPLHSIGFVPLDSARSLAAKSEFGRVLTPAFDRSNM
jgi:hypothetical protein